MRQRRNQLIYLKLQRVNVRQDGVDEDQFAQNQPASFELEEIDMEQVAASLKGVTQSVQQFVLHWLLSHERRHDHMTMRYLLLAWAGCFLLPGYYVVWTYWFPQGYENLGVRLFGVLLLLPVFQASRLLATRYGEAYLFACLTYTLPFFFTFMYLMNYGSPVWSQSLLIGLIILFHFHFLTALASYAIGSAFACGLFAVMGDPDFLLSDHVLEQLPVYFFTILFVSLAKVGQRVLAQEKLAGMAQGLATVSHELRTPLVSVDANVRGINRRLAEGRRPTDSDLAALGEAMARIQFEVRHMNHMIDLFLLSASAVNQQLEATEHVSMQDVVDAVLRRYPFTAQSQRDAVSVRVRRDFTFAGRHELSVVILLNLLRNALKALHRAGKGRIRIVIDGTRSVPRLLFIDTGCGIAAPHLPLIFKRFYSYPPSSGSGIGLALCKEIVEAWQASIRCFSRELCYTTFVLEFPRVQQEPSCITHTATQT
jgi:two-component system CAI-1 autoinducer sensor kinase/phosphatase CqsS